MTEFILALSSNCSRLTLRRILPTRRDAAMNAGNTAIATALSRHSILTITARVTRVETRFAVSVTNVPVTACCAPTTSLLSRLITSPVLVDVKKPSDIRWRCP